MTHPDLRESVLDQLLAEARSKAPDPSPAFLGRALEAAYAAQPASASAGVRPVSDVVSPALRLRRWLSQLGAPAGLVTAVLAGFWIGFAQPTALLAPVTSVGEAVAGSEDVFEMVDLIPSFDGWLSEG